MKLIIAVLCALPLFIFASGCTPEQEIATAAHSPQISPRPVQTTPPPVETQQIDRQIADVASQANSVKTTRRQESAPGSRISFEKTVHDYGVVAPRSVSVGDFAFTNTGDEVLRIERFHAPCGCSVPELPKRDYAPGESGIIQVRYSAPAGAAVDVYPVYVYSNDPENPQFELTVKAKVIVNVEVDPQEVSLQFDQDNTGMHALTVKSTDAKEFAITQTTSTNNVVDIPFDRNERRTSSVLEPKVDLTRLETSAQGVIQIHTDHPHSGVMNVRFNAKPMFEVSHPRIILQNITPGQDVTHDVWIRSNYDQKVEIESYTSTHGMMSIDSQEQDGNHLKLQVKIVPAHDAASAGRRYITDELKIQLTSGHDLSIRCSGWFRLN